MRGAGATARFVRSSSVGAGINSMLTDYEAGMLRLMPMRVHLAVDFVMGAALCAVAIVPSEVRSAGRSAASVALGV